MRFIRFFGYLAGLVGLALLTLDGASSIVSGKVGLLSIAETWELLGPYLAYLPSYGWSSTLLPTTPVDQLQFPATLAMLCVTGMIFLLDLAVRRFFTAVQQTIRQFLLVGS